MLVIPDAGHHTNMEWPALVLAEVRDLLAATVDAD
jgi:pimeloyl-ACP methyl ester carboxylesterase